MKSSLIQDRQEAVEDGTVRFEDLIQESDLRRRETTFGLPSEFIPLKGMNRQRTEDLFRCSKPGQKIIEKMSPFNRFTDILCKVGFRRPRRAKIEDILIGEDCKNGTANLLVPFDEMRIK